MGKAQEITSRCRCNRRNGKIKRIIEHRWFYLFLLPGFLSVVIFSYIPLYGLIGAFQNYNPFNGFFSSPWVGFNNFETLFALPAFKKVFFNTLKIGVWSFIIGFPLPIILAILFNEIKNPRFKKISQTISYIPNFISWVVAAGIFYQLLSADGVVNDILKLFGKEKVVYFLGEPKWFLPILIVTGQWKGVGFASILYLAVLTGINPELYESADIDGASKIKKILYITLPGIMPTITLQLVLCLSNLLNVNFEQIYNLQNNMNMSASDVIDTYVYRIAIAGNISDYSRGIALGLFRAVIGVLLFLIANKSSQKLGNGTVL